jgi:hypothetical protein
MIQLASFIAVGLGLLILLFLATRRRPMAAEGSAGALVAAKRSLQALQVGLLPVELIDRIFGKGDLKYVSMLGSREIQDLFEDERKRLALAWVGQVREQIRNLRNFHTRQSRMFARMSRRTELSVALNFAELQFRCRLLELMLRWRGPYAAPYLVRSTATAAGGLCSVFDRSLAFLTPSIAEGLPNDSGAGTAAD